MPMHVRSVAWVLYTLYVCLKSSILNIEVLRESDCVAFLFLPILRSHIVQAVCLKAVEAILEFLDEGRR